MNNHWVFIIVYCFHDSTMLYIFHIKDMSEELPRNYGYEIMFTAQSFESIFNDLLSVVVTISFYYYCVCFFYKIARPNTLVNALYSIQLKKHLVIGQFNFKSVFSAFHSLPSIGKFRMAPVFFVKATESYEVCRLGHHFSSTYTGTDRNERA